MKKRTIIAILTCLVASGVTSCVLDPKDNVITRSALADSHGFKHFVTVRKFKGRFKTQLSTQGNWELPVSMYEFYGPSGISWVFS